MDGRLQPLSSARRPPESILHGGRVREVGASAMRGSRRSRAELPRLLAAQAASLAWSAQSPCTATCGELAVALTHESL